jgi:hypothetical protein
LRRYNIRESQHQYEVPHPAPHDRSGRVAVIAGADSGTVQALLSAAVSGWRAQGVRVAGVIAETHGLAGRSCAAGFLRDVTSGRRFPIYLDAAPAGSSCHLDAGGVTAACEHLLGQVSGSDLVVLSKYGKLEAMRAGLMAVFEAAIAAGKPLLTSVSGRQRDAWEAFAPAAVRLPAETGALQDWWQAQRRS